jgi:hypothetical protein
MLVSFCKFTNNDLKMVIYKMLSYPINNIKYKIIKLLVISCNNYL